MSTHVRRVVRLTHRTVYILTAGVMALFGILLSTAAMAAGVKSVDVLAMMFLLGAAGSLLALVIWYLLSLKVHSSHRHR